MDCRCSAGPPRRIVDGMHSTYLTADHARHALLGNRYAVGPVPDGDRWVMRTVRIDNVWFTGDPAAIFGG